MMQVNDAIVKPLEEFLDQLERDYYKLQEIEHKKERLQYSQTHDAWQKGVFKALEELCPEYKGFPIGFYVDLMSPVIYYVEPVYKYDLKIPKKLMQPYLYREDTKQSADLFDNEMITIYV